MLLLCWFIYSCAYLCRVNYSMAVPFMQAAFGWDKAAAGMMAGGFFWAYAAGQVVNGRIGDRVNSRSYVAIGLAASGICNLAMGFTGSGGVMLALWTLNGFFQSMLFGPIMRTLSRFVPEKKHPLMAVAISTTPPVGFFISYLLIGRMANEAYWRAMFEVPGLLLMALAGLWVVMYGYLRKKDAIKTAEAAILNKETGSVEPLKQANADKHKKNINPADGSLKNKADKTEKPDKPDKAEKPNKTDKTEKLITSEDNGAAGPDDNDKAHFYKTDYFTFILSNKLWLIACISILLGIIKEGVNLWGPSFMSDLQKNDLATTLSFMSFIPVMSFFGSMMIGFVNKLFGYREKRTMILFFAVCALFLTTLLYAGAGYGAGTGANANAVNVANAAGLNALNGKLLLTLFSYGMITASINAAGSLLTVFIPLNFRREGRVSTTAGFIDCAVYMGAALSGPLLGALADRSGWSGAMLLWIGVALISIILSVLSRDYKKRSLSSAG